MFKNKILNQNSIYSLHKLHYITSDNSIDGYALLVCSKNLTVSYSLYLQMADLNNRDLLFPYNVQWQNEFTTYLLESW